MAVGGFSDLACDNTYQRYAHFGDFSELRGDFQLIPGALDSLGCVLCK